MSKIKAIRINNFKFFGKSDPIVLDGRNLLLYGENGSGKSSVYNALYTLFEAASKTPDGVRKYFVPLSEDAPESLVNIHAPLDENGQVDSFIEITNDANQTYRISYNDTALCGNEAFLESQRASDFINYQSLFRFQLSRNSEYTNLHDVFMDAVIPYIPCQAFEYQGKILTTLSSLFDAYRDHESLKEENRNQVLVIYKHSVLYRNYCALEERINRELRELIDYINAQLPSLLESLGYDFGVYLEYIDQSHHKYERWIQPYDFSVNLIVDHYEGKDIVVKHPNVFLNEAKMAALSFAIRWAILTRRPDVNVAPNALHVLVLDDLMISLDMGNRRRVVNFLLTNEKAQEYQLLFLTHERKLFEFIINELRIKYNTREDDLEKNGWVIKELYSRFKEGHSLPVLQPYNSNFGKAIAFFNGHDGQIDYCACGNALRKAIEEEFKRIYAMWGVEFDGKTITMQSKLMIQNGIDIAKKQFVLHKIDENLIKELQYLSSFVLNPASHYDPESNFYRTELEDAFVAFEKLCKIHTYVVIPHDSTLSFRIQCTSGNEFLYEMDICKDILAHISVENGVGEMIDMPMQITIREVGRPDSLTHERKTLEYVYKKTVKFLTEKKHEQPIDKSDRLWDELYMGGISINTYLLETIRNVQRRYNVGV